MGDTTVVLIDDFGRDDGGSALGTVWRGFSDQVMGGVSQEQVTFAVVEGRRCLQLRGRVRLDNNGGFIQMALPLDARGQPLDAEGFSGLRLGVRGNGERYYVHLRSPDALRPWQLYRASFVAPPRWTTVELPFTAFEAKDLAIPLDIRRLTRLGIVAAGAAFDADVAISRVELYA